MPLPIVHHPAYVAPMPSGHRFPMGKFGRLMTHLLEQRLVAPEQVQVPELAPPEWLALAHAPEYVDAVLGIAWTRQRCAASGCRSRPRSPRARAPPMAARC